MRRAFAGLALLAVIAPSQAQTPAVALTQAEVDAVIAGVDALKLEAGPARDCVVEQAKTIMPGVPAMQVVQEGRNGALKNNKQLQQNPMIQQLQLQFRAEAAVQKAQAACAKPAGAN